MRDEELKERRTRKTLMLNDPRDAFPHQGVCVWTDGRWTTDPVMSQYVGRSRGADGGGVLFRSTVFCCDYWRVQERA